MEYIRHPPKPVPSDWFSRRQHELECTIDREYENERCSGDGSWERRRGLRHNREL